MWILVVQKIFSFLVNGVRAVLESEDILFNIQNFTGLLEGFG